MGDLDDAALDCGADRLGAATDRGARGKARALFAEVLDLPGGMRIGTIHAFCQSLLRRFPLEARLSPHFRLIEDRDADEALRDAREHMLARAASPAHRTALDDLAGLATLDGFGRLVAGLQSDRPRLARALELPDLAAAQRRALGIIEAGPDGVIAAATSWPEEAAVTEAAQRVHRDGSPKCAERAGCAAGVARPVVWGARRALGRMARQVPQGGWRARRIEPYGQREACQAVP